MITITDDSVLIGLVSSYLSLPAYCQLPYSSVSLSTLYILYNSFLHPLARFPGPISARLGLPFWQFRQAYQRRYVWKLEELHDKYGCIVRIGPNHLSMTSCDAVNQIYAHGSKFNKTDFYKSFQVYAHHPSIFSDIDPASHADRRRAVSSAYSMSSLISLEQYIEPLIESLSSSLRSIAESRDEKTGQSMVNMTDWMHFFAMDSVGELAFGKAFGFVQRGSDPNHFLQGVSNLSHWGSMAGWVPSLSVKIRSVLRFISGQSGGEVVDSMTRPLIDARYQALEEKRIEAKKSGIEIGDDDIRQDLLAKFIKSKDPRTGTLFTSHQVLTTAISVVGAGSDTTSVALTAFFGYLLQHPDVYAAVEAEIDEAFDNDLLNDPVSYAQGVKLELTQACIKETLRLHPPISMSLPRIVPKGGVVVDGQYIPAGVEVSVSPYVFHRTKQAYGNDARLYDPYRWLNVTESERRRLEKNNLTFGGGSRQCIGKNISLMELSKVLPTLLRQFHFSLPKSKEDRTRRDSDGKMSTTSPWDCDSTWFLDAKNLSLMFTVRDN